jgi:lysophospholipase L1-like esterase
MRILLAVLLLATISALAATFFGVPVPVPASGLALWLRSTDLALSGGASIPTAAGALGFGLGAQTTAGNQPTYQSNVFGSTPSMRFFHGASSYFSLSSSLSANQSTGVTAILIGRVDVNEGSPSIALNLGTTNFLFKTLDFPNLGQLGLYTNGSGDTVSGLITPARLCVFGISMNGTTKANTYYVNSSTVTKTAASTNANAIVDGQLGTWTGGGNYPLSMDVVEFLEYNRNISSAEYTAIENYAVRTYGVVTSTGTTQVFGYGNSITAGHGISDGGTWPNQLQPQMAAGTVVYNLGRSSATTPDLSTNYATSLAPFYDGAKTNAVVLWEVRNDVCNAGADATTAYNDYVTLAQTAKATGFKVVAVTTPPSGGCTGAQLTAITTVNANVLANFVSSGYADIVADLAANACLGVNTDHTCYQNDNTHLNSNGESVAAGILKTALNSIGVN